MMSLGSRIRELLHTRGYSQTDLSNYLGKSNSFVSQILNGKAPINTENLSAICAFLDVSLSEFFQPFQDEIAPTPEVSALLNDCRKLSVSDIEAIHFLVRHLIKKNEITAHSVAASAHCNSAISRAVVSVATDEGEEAEDDAEPKYYLPLLGGAAAGSPIYRPADDGDLVAVPEAYADPDRYAVFQARGDSMEPRISDGAFVVVAINELPQEGEVGVIMLSSFADAEYVVKRFFRSQHEVILKSYNRKYTDMTIDPEEVRSAYRMVDILS